MSDKNLVKGHWERVGRLGHHYCSVCKESLPSVTYMQGCYDEDYEQCEEIDKTPYCPYCGAKMDAKEEELCE